MSAYAGIALLGVHRELSLRYLPRGIKEELGEKYGLTNKAINLLQDMAVFNKPMVVHQTLLVNPGVAHTG